MVSYAADISCTGIAGSSTRRMSAVGPRTGYRSAQSVEPLLKGLCASLFDPFRLVLCLVVDHRKFCRYVI